MKIKISHHYWKDQTNAVWSPGVFPYPAIEAEIKRLYPILATESPQWRQFGSLTVFFDYRPEKDVYGRDIVPISFAFLPDCQDPEKCSQQILNALSRAGRDAEEINVEISPACLRKTHHKMGKSIKIVLAALISLAVCGLFTWLALPGRQTPAPSMPEKSTEKPGIEQHPETISPAASPENALPASQPRLEAQQGGNAGATPETTEVNIPEYAQINPQGGRDKLAAPSLDICGNTALINKLYPCFGNYVKHKCENGINDIMPFDEWWKNNKECDSLNKRIRVPEAMNYLKKNLALTREEEKQLHDIFRKNDRKKRNR